MAHSSELRTKRLLLRCWNNSDRESFAAMNADAVVMEFFPALMSRTESEAAADRIENHFEQHGFGLWAVELPDQVPFVGFIGLSITRIEAHFTPCVELGWRLLSQYWNQGIATEGALAAIAFGFEQLALDEIVSYTAVPNRRSRRVMEKLGMTHDPHEDFDHPLIPVGHPLRRHVLFRLPRSGKGLIRNPTR
jgi:RimJ/RimL family protein N-acetyltransferase